VTQKLWPDFSRDDLREAIEEFGRRNRRYGGV
jgi:undecaprenyl diphosphate synthase